MSSTAPISRRAQVTLVDAWGTGHSRSSSGDETRVIRAVYNSNATLTVMVQRAFTLRKEAQAHWQRPVLTRTGAIYMFEWGRQLRLAVGADHARPRHPPRGRPRERAAR